MRRDEVLRILGEHLPEIQGRYGVSSLRIFGSVARGDAASGSDVDILVDFDETPSLFGFLKLRGFLADLLGTKVDLITESGLKERVRPYVEQDAISVA
jgi:predicted nucleotidyltransferase